MTRNLAICLVPTVVALLAIYWFRKKKKIKYNEQTCNHSTNIIKIQDEKNLKISSSECVSDLDNTLSDASSFASPINSEKSWDESPLYTSPSQDVSEESLQNLSNCAHTLEEDVLLKKTSEFYKYKDLQNDISNIDLQNIKAESIKYKDLQQLVSPNLISTKDLNLLEGDDECLPFVKRNVSGCETIETLKENHSDDLKTLNKYVNSYQHNMLLQETEKDTVKAVSPCLKELERIVDLDSQSSVFDENSLSYISDDSEARHLSEYNNKDSLSSILDESSSLSNFCEELEKSANSQISPTVVPKQTHSMNDNSRDVLNLMPLKDLALLLEQDSKNTDAHKELNNCSPVEEEDFNNHKGDKVSTDENELVTSTINSNSFQVSNDFSDCSNTKSTSPSNSDSAIQSGDESAVRTVVHNIFSDFNSSLPASVEDNLICKSSNLENNSIFSVLSKQKENSVPAPVLDIVNSNHGFFLKECVPSKTDSTSNLDSTDSSLKDSCDSNTNSHLEPTNHLNAAADVVHRISSDFNSSLSILLDKTSAWNSPNLKSNVKWSPSWTKCEPSSELKSSSVLSDVTPSAKDVCDNIKSSILLQDKTDNSESNLSSTVTEIDKSKTVSKVTGESPSNSSGIEENHVKVAKLIQKEINGISDVKVSSQSSSEFVYEFELPQELCGRLIGRHGRHVKSIMERSNANVFIKRHPYDPLLKVVVVEGLRSDVNDALEIIRRKYPLAQYPTVTLLQTNVIGSTGVPIPESLQLHLPEGASCDVILSSLVSAGHFFLQQPTHPTYPSLSTLDQCMINLYSQMDTPLLPQPIEAGVICSAPVYRGWYRAQVVYICDNSTDCGIKFVDYGGFSQVPISSLRQIRSDFMSLPFQASECYLAHVRPIGGESWSSEATSTFEELAQGQILQALLVEYAEDGIPCVYLYRVQGVSSTFINKELVERGLAVWVNSNHWDPH